jgi:predicted nucleotidyltransferase
VAVREQSSVWVYGSTARGDGDERSDVDILIAGDGRWWRDAVAADAEVTRLVREGRQLSPMHFSWSEIEAMCAYGSLFLHHVRLHGRPLSRADDDPLCSLLDELPPYRRAVQEIEAFAIVLHDVAAALAADHSPTFELAVIATALRHAFILGCYVEGDPDFGRTTPFDRLARQLDMPPETADELARLYDFRLHQQGRAPVPFQPATNDVRYWLEVADTLLATIRRRVNDFDRAVSRASGSGSGLSI